MGFEGSIFPDNFAAKYWAPSAPVKHDGRYYLFPTLDGKITGTVSESLTGPFKTLDGKDIFPGSGWSPFPIQQNSAIDAEIFRDDDGSEHVRELTYEQSWGQVLQRHRQWRCHVCADHTGEFADVAVGDPWYRPIGRDEAGDSLIVARTARGRRIVEQAIAAGYLDAKPVGVEILAASQPNLLKTCGAVWGRLLVLRLLGCLAPRYRNMPLFRHWRRLGGATSSGRWWAPPAGSIGAPSTGG